jgi:hypothetical protein
MKCGQPGLMHGIICLAPLKRCPVIVMGLETPDVLLTGMVTLVAH